jgi:hypothetical protein
VTEPGEVAALAAREAVYEFIAERVGGFDPHMGITVSPAGLVDLLLVFTASYQAAYEQAQRAKGTEHEGSVPS